MADKRDLEIEVQRLLKLSKKLASIGKKTASRVMHQQAKDIMGKLTYEKVEGINAKTNT